MFREVLALVALEQAALALAVLEAVQVALAPMEPVVAEVVPARVALVGAQAGLDLTEQAEVRVVLVQ